MCCTLLQVADFSTEGNWQYAGSCLIIPCGTQFTNRFPTIVEPGNHISPLRNAEGVPYPMEAVEDFVLEDKIFPGIPGDSLLFNGTKLVSPTAFRPHAEWGLSPGCWHLGLGHAVEEACTHPRWHPCGYPQPLLCALSSWFNRIHKVQSIPSTRRSHLAHSLRDPNVDQGLVQLQLLM